MVLPSSLLLLAVLCLSSFTVSYVIRDDRTLAARQSNSTGGGLVQALRENGLTATADALSTSPGILQRMYASPGPKTFLAPTDAAVEAAPSWLNLPPTLLYHLLNGTAPLDKLSCPPSHTVLHSFLTDVQYANLPGGNGQAVALSTGKQGYGQMNEALGSDSFSTSVDPFTLDDVLVQPVDQVMMLPRTAMFTLMQVTNNTLTAALLQYLPFSLDGMRGVTLFAPSDAAVQRFKQRNPSITDAALLNTFLNHLVADRVVYSPLLIAQGSIITMAGQDMRVTTTTGMSALQVSLSNGASANIVQTDVMHRGGVIHLIDEVLDDTQNDGTRGQQAALSSLRSADSFVSGPVSATNSASSQGVTVPPSPPGSPSPQAQNSSVTVVFDATENGALTILPGTNFTSAVPNPSTSSSRYSSGSSGAAAASASALVATLCFLAAWQLFF